MDDEEVKVDNEQPAPAKKSLPKRLLRVLMWFVLTIVGLNVLLYVLLSIPAVQQKVKDIAVNELKAKLKTEITIDELRLSLFNKVSLKGIYVEDLSKDTLLYANTLTAGFDIKKLLYGELLVTDISLDDFVINVTQKDAASDFNFQFVINAFASGDTTVQDSTPSTLSVVIKDIDISKGRLAYHILSDSLTPGLFNTSHIVINDFNANIDLNSIDMCELDVAINSFSAHEQSGLTIKSLKGHLYSQGDQLWIDKFMLELPDSHLNTDKLRYNLSSAAFGLSTEDTEISASDLQAFMPDLKQLNKHKLSLNTTIEGKLPQISVQQLRLSYGQDLILGVNGNMEDCYNYTSSDFEVTVSEFQLSPSGLTAFARLGDPSFATPDVLNSLGNVYMKSRLKGRLSNFNLNTEAWTRYGGLNIFALGATDSSFNNYRVKADVDTKNFNLGGLLGKESGLGRLAAGITLTASQTSRQPLSASLKGKVDMLQYEEQTVRDVPFEAFYDADNMGLSLDADLPIGHIAAAAAMSQAKVPDVHFDLKVDSLQVASFYKNDRWKEPKLSFSLSGDIKGLDIDNMSGRVLLEELSFRDSTFNFAPGAISLDMGQKNAADKYIHLASSLFTARIEGKYKFSTLPDEISNLMHNYLSSVFRDANKRIKNQNDFTFYLASQNTEELGRIFDLPADIVTPATIEGRINTIDRKIDINGTMPLIRYNDTDIRATRLALANQDSAFSISAAADVAMEKGKYGLSLKVRGADNALHSLFDVKSDSTDVPIDGRVEAHADFSIDEKTKDLISSFRFVPSDIKVGGLDMALLPAQILNKGDYTRINDLGLSLNGKRYFGVDGIISEQKTDTLAVYFDQAQIADVLVPFDIKNIKAVVDGEVLLTNILDKPELYTKGFEIADIVLFSDTLGTMNIESRWNESLGAVKLNALLNRDRQKVASVDGLVYTASDSLDLKVDMDKFPLHWAEPFLAGLLNKLSGSMSTGLSVKGRMSAPVVEGWLGLNNTSLGIDYTNVVYTISDTIRITPEKVGFDNLVIRDSRNNQGTISAIVTHHNFDKMKYSLDMDMKNLMVLNTASRTDSLFYGQMFMSGKVKIAGDDNGMKLDLRVRNEKNSNINILIPQTSEASDYQSVVYINVPQDKLEKAATSKTNVLEKQKPMSINLAAAIDVTSDLGIGVVIDPKTGDNMQVKGSGHIDFGYNLDTGNMSAEGEYNITSGSVKVNLQKISNLEFKIKEGSRLAFIGDPLKTKFNITAYRRIRASLETLDPNFATMDNAVASKVAVDCVLGISGNMDKMTITYNIDLPDAPDDIKQKVKSLIATDEQKTKQFAYLVAFGSFYSSTGSSGVGGGLWTSLASSTLSDGLNAVFGNLLGESWEIGTDIESTDGTFSNMDMRVNVSKKFLNDKLKFNTSLVYSTDQTSSDNSVIGDFDLEYQLNPLWTLKAYNKANDKYYKQASTTQGIGIMYTREARSLKRLFRFFGKDRRRMRTSRTEDKVPQPSQDSLRQKQPAINEERK